MVTNRNSKTYNFANMAVVKQSGVCVCVCVCVC